MTLRGGTQDDQQSRLRVGLVVLMVGLVVLLAAIGMAIMRSPSQIDVAEKPGSLADEGLLAGAAVSMLVIMGVVLVVILLVASYALFRLTRNLAVPDRKFRKQDPTPTDDVWQQHKLPEEDFDPQDRFPAAQ
ncbi:MAG: hypothetical protein ACE5GE_02030 [Phycisphaerae bacterium]